MRSMKEDSPDVNPYDLSKLEGVDFTELRDIIGMDSATLEGTILTIGPQTSVVVE